MLWFIDATATIGTLLRSLQTGQSGVLITTKQRPCRFSQGCKTHLGWLRAQAFILWWGLYCYCLYVVVSTLLGHSQNSCSNSARLHWLSFYSISLQAGSFSLSASPEGSPAVCLSMRGISDLLQRTIFWDLSETLLSLLTFSLFIQYGQLQSKRLLTAPVIWKDFPLSLHRLSISAEIISLFPCLCFINSFCSCSCFSLYLYHLCCKAFSNPGLGDFVLF